MESLLADIRHALRVLIKNPIFTAVAVTALAMGIGVNIAIFSVVNAVMLQPLPYPSPNQIVKLGRSYPQGVGYSISIPKYMVWRQNNVFSAMAAYDQGGPGFNLSGTDRPEQVKGMHVSSEYFKVFGVTPSAGRTFTANEDVPNGPRVMVISEKLWRSRFSADPHLVGHAIDLNHEPFTVVGILPDTYKPNPPADIWIPLQADPASTNQGHYLAVAARLKPAVKLETARAEMKILGERFRHRFPDSMDKGESVTVVPMREAMIGNVRTALLVLIGAVAFVLLIACANVANLLLARAATRQRELAIRAAVGADRWRVVRQLLTESILLAGVGGMMGFLVGIWGVRTLLRFVPGNIPRLTASDGSVTALSMIDARVAIFTIGISLLTGVVFGLFPALQVSKQDLASTLKEASGRSGTGLRQNRVRGLLVITEMALALVLLVGAALLIRTFVKLKSVQIGIDAHHVVTLRTSLAGQKYATTRQVDNLIVQALRRIEGLPGIEAAATAIAVPAENEIDLPFTITGKPPANGQKFNGDEQWRSVSPHYFAVFKIPRLRGRVFDERDTSSAAPVVVINSAMARKYWPKEDAIGQVITIGKGLGPQFDDPPRQIVGIVGNVRETGLSDSDVGVMYLPEGQVPNGLTALANSVIPLAWAIRSSKEPATLAVAVEREIRGVDSQMPVSKVATMEQLLSEQVSRQNFNMLLLTIFAGIACTLAAIGIYGLMSYAVEQRTQELGIRMALGAERSDMLRLVLAQGMKLACAGVVIGAGIAFALARLLTGMLYGVKASDPSTFVGVALLLTAVALVATYIPARRAMRVDPVVALRNE
jgi:putative ABC transport system permease protein